MTEDTLTLEQIRKLLSNADRAKFDMDMLQLGSAHAEQLPDGTWQYVSTDEANKAIATPGADRELQPRTD